MPDGYRNLNVAEVLADLPSLDRAQLELVKSLEEAGDRRPVILDRVADLMVVQEAAAHVRSADLGNAAAPAPPVPPPAPNRDLSPDLLAQMGGLLAKETARRSQDFQAAWPLPETEPPVPGSMESIAAPPTAVATGAPVVNAPKAQKVGTGPKEPKASRAPRDSKAAKAPKRPRGSSSTRPLGGHLGASPGLPTGHIVPGDGRRSRSGKSGPRFLKAVMALVILGGLAAGGLVVWQRINKSPATAPVIVPSAASAPAARTLILQAIPGTGYILQHPGTPPAPITLATAAVEDGTTDATAVLTKDGYRNGSRQIWSNTTHAGFVSLTVLQFRTAPGAIAYSQRLIAAATGKPVAPPRFPVAGVAGAVGLGPTSVNRTAQVIFTRGPYLVKVVVDNGNSVPGGADQATVVAANQYRALPSQ